MTNAQAALLASVQFMDKAATADDVKRQAERFKLWLDQTDAADKARIRVGD